MTLGSRQFFLGLACSLALFPNVINAQDSDLGNWLIYIGSKKINKTWNWHHEFQHRNYNVIGDLEQLLLRTGLGYTIKDKNQNFLLGYGYILSENYDRLGEKISVNEHRIFQQVISQQSITNLKFSHRFRFEQRFIESAFKMRFRYFLSSRVPLGSDNKFYLSGYNELFIGLGKDFFDRNRIYGGIGYKLFEGVNIELGYMNQFLGSLSRDQINVIMLLNL